MRKFVSALVVSGLAAVGLAVTAAPASATANSQCPQYKVCLYDGLSWNSGLSGSSDLWSDITVDVADLRRYYWHDGNGNITGSSVQDDITSIKNRTTCDVWIYEHINFDISGHEYIIRPGEYIGNLASLEINNEISSIAFVC